MKKIFQSIFPLLILVSSCATYIDVKVMKPAKIDIGNVKTIAVLDYDFIGSWNFDEEDEPETFTEIAKEGLKKSLGLIEKKAPPPDPYTAFPGKDVSKKFISKLVDNGFYKIVEREQISKILDEQSLSMSGVLDISKASEVGNILGVDAIIIGSGNYSVVDDGGWYERKVKDDDGIERKQYFYKIIRKIDVLINYKVVSIETGEIVASKEHTASNYDESKLFFPYDDYIEAGDEEAARENVPEWKPIVNKLTNRIVKKAIKQIAPYYKTVEREIKSGESAGMKAGLKYAERNLWDDAKRSWEKVVESKSSNAQKDKVKAIYNLGVYYEIHDELEVAENHFTQCFDLSGKTEYLDAKKRIRKRMKEVEELEKQQNRD